MNQIWPKNKQNLRYLHYWQSYRVEMGTKMSGGNPSSWYFRFLARPCGFRAFRNEKLIKFRLFWRFLALFERFLDYNSSVTTWSRMGPVNLNRGVHSWDFGTLYNPLASSIVIWYKKWAPSSSVPYSSYFKAFLEISGIFWGITNHIGINQGKIYRRNIWLVDFCPKIGKKI